MRAALRLGNRFLYLSNSLVDMAVIIKFRGSSPKLSKVCRPAAAFLLAASFQPMLWFTWAVRKPGPRRQQKIMVKRRSATSCSQEAVEKMAKAELGREMDRKAGKVKALRCLQTVESFCSRAGQQGCQEVASLGEPNVQVACCLEVSRQEDKTKTLSSLALSSIKHLLQTKQKLPGARPLGSTWPRLEG